MLRLLCVSVWGAWGAWGATAAAPPSLNLTQGATFDYIVVGAGAGGCPAAARLAQAGHRVLLLEAGGAAPALARVPAAALALLGSAADWSYRTESNNASCLASRGRACRFSRGKCWGGSTAINYMLYTRGNRRDYDLGAPPWTWRDLERYFLRSEGLRSLDRYPPSSRRYHNASGPLAIDFFGRGGAGERWRATLEAGFRRLGFPSNADANGASQIGVTTVAGYTRRGERESAASAYLWRSGRRGRPSLAGRTRCTRVLLDERNVARGVEAARPGGETLRLYARREVILSAGAIGTAQILMLSGVGPAGHLRGLGIPVRVDLPVGDDMSDHVLAPVLGLVDREASALRELAALAAGAVEYAVRRTGPLASVGLLDLNVFANAACSDRRLARSSAADCELPDVQILNAYVPKGVLPPVASALARATSLDAAALDLVVAANAGRALLVHSPVVLRPRSRGRVRLAGADPALPPAIFPNYLGDERDADQMARSIEIVERLYGTREMRRRGARLLRPAFAGCAGRGRAYWRCYARHMTHPGFHAVGTCALRRVVDSRLRVRGVRRLRVADAGVLPVLPRGNSAAAVFAIGELVADLVLQDASRR